MNLKVFVCLLMMPLALAFNFQQLQQSQDSQVLGILKQNDLGSAGSFPPYIQDLLPELISASAQIKSTDVVDTVVAYMPFARKIMAAQSPNGQLTAEQERQISFTEKVVPPMMRFVEGISGGSSLSQFPLNATPDDDFTDVMIKMLPDISDIINQLKAKYGGWPGTDKSVEIMNAFMPLARKATLYQAQLKGRQVTEEEEAYLKFTEKVVPSIMNYSQDLYNKNVQPGQEYNIEQLVKSAVEDLHKITNQVSTSSLAGRMGSAPRAYTAVSHVQVGQGSHSPASYRYDISHNSQLPLVYLQPHHTSQPTGIRVVYDESSEEW